MSEKVKLYNPNDGVTGRAPGTYLDLEQAKAREARSAKLEKRKADYSELLSVGIPLQREDQIKDRNYIPDIDLYSGDVADKEEKHLSEGAVTEVSALKNEGFKTSDAKEESDFLEQGEKNRVEQGNK